LLPNNPSENLGVMGIRWPINENAVVGYQAIGIEEVYNGENFVFAELICT
jgi:hypothetical protein